MRDATGTRRRLQALAAIGWSQAEIAARLGVSQQNVHDFITRVRVHGPTAEKVAALYDELSMVPGPNRRARLAAERKGWVPPLGWDDIDDPDEQPTLGTDADIVDELAVEAVLEGHRLQLTGATAHAAVLALTERSLTRHAIAERCGLDVRQVYRLRNRDTPPRPMRGAA